MTKKLILVENTTGSQLFINSDFIVGVVPFPNGTAAICLSHAMGVGNDSGTIILVPYSEWVSIAPMLTDDPVKAKEA